MNHCDTFVSLVSWFGYLASLIPQKVAEIREVKPWTNYVNVVINTQYRDEYINPEIEVIQLDIRKWQFDTGSQLDGRYLLGIGYGEKSQILLWWTEKVSIPA